MAGLKNNSANVTYLKFKDGLFFSNKDKDNGYNEFEGYITNFNIVDEEYEGNSVRKLVIKLTDTDGENYILKITFEASYATSLIGFLKNADFDQLISLVGILKEGDDGKKRGSILVKQGGTFLKGYYTKDNPNGLPQMKQITVNKKKVWDKSEMIEFLEDAVLNEFNDRTAKVNFKAKEPAETPKEEAVDDLPF